MVDDACLVSGLVLVTANTRKLDDAAACWQEVTEAVCGTGQHAWGCVQRLGVQCSCALDVMMLVFIAAAGQVALCA